MTDNDDLATEALLDFLDAVEAGVAAAKQRIGTRKAVTPHANYDDAGWSEVKGTRGVYEQVSRKLAKVDVFDRLAAELKQHNGFWKHDGFSYWFHQNDDTVIDRRKNV